MSKFKGRRAMRKGVDIKPVKTPQPCLACNGSGRYDTTGSPKCGACRGTGKERKD